MGCSAPRFEVAGDGGSDAGGAGSGGQDASAGSSAMGGSAGGAATGGSAGAGGGTGGNTGCGGTDICAPPAPSGWSGPFALAKQLPAPSCPTGWSPDANFSANQTLQPGTACQCSCGGSATCSDKIEVTAFADYGSCTTKCAGPYTLGSTCQLLPTNCGPRIQVQAADVTNNCFPLSTSVPTPKWKDTLTSCKAPTGDQCVGGGTCVPGNPAPFNRLCIAQLGDAQCSVPGYPNKLLGHKDFSDDRACSGKCKCDVLDPGTVNVYPPGGCTTATVTIKATAQVQCQPGVSTGPLDFIKGACTCSPSGLGTTGTATATDPVTYCCTT